MPIKFDQRPKISAGATEIIKIDFTDQLDSGSDELLTGTPTVTEVTTSDLTLANKMVSTITMTILDREVAAGMAVTFKVTGQKAGTQYQFRVSVGTTSSPARTLVFDGIFDCI